MKGATKARERVIVSLAREELKAINDFRFARRMPNRASAIRELLRSGLAADGMEIPIGGEDAATRHPPRKH
jgi:metal-responsive CopG/Arc/MetJ family transcriptional regulator